MDEYSTLVLVTDDVDLIRIAKIKRDLKLTLCNFALATKAENESGGNSGLTLETALLFESALKSTLLGLDQMWWLMAKAKYPEIDLSRLCSYQFINGGTKIQITDYSE